MNNKFVSSLRTFIIGTFFIGATQYVSWGATPSPASPTSTISPTIIRPSRYESRTIHVEGVGSVNMTPDMAYLWFGITQEGNDINLMTETVERKMDFLTQILEKHGVSPNDIQMLNFNVNPSLQMGVYGRMNTHSIDVVKRVRVTVRDLTKIEKLFHLAEEAGVNEMTGPIFEASNRSKLENQALEKALDDAKTKATNIAQSFGETLGEVISVNENPIQHSYDEYLNFQPIANTAPIPVKYEKVEVRVNVNFRIADR